jgi:hypothetical protein
MGYILSGGEKSAERLFVEGQLSTVVEPGSKIVGSNYRQSLRYAFYLERVQVYGRADQGYDVSDPAFQQVLRDKDISYYILFTPADQESLDLSALGPIVKTHQMISTCDDLKGSAIVECRIEVIKVTP